MKKYFWSIIIILILVAIAVLRLASGPEDIWLCTDGNWVSHGHPSAPMPVAYCPGGPTNDSDEENSALNPVPVNTPNPEVIISEPVADGVVKSPLKINGQAKGGWFFEAVLPVKLVTADDEVIASVSGRAQSDWMTSEFVPFTATLSFTTTATSGYLVIAKDNPSGLPENDASIKIPINFK